MSVVRELRRRLRANSAGSSFEPSPARATLKSRRLGPTGFTKSSMTASASSLGATLPGCALSRATDMTSPIASPHCRGDRRIAGQPMPGRRRGNCSRRKWAVSVRPDPLSAAGPYLGVREAGSW